VAGPHDTQYTFTYWVRRASRGGRVALLDRPEQSVQVIDSRDLARLVVRLLPDRRPGASHAVGPAEPTTMAELIATYARVAGGGWRVAGSEVEIVPVPADVAPPLFPLVRPETVRILDKHAVVHMAEDDEGNGGRPEVDRGQLRELLLGALPEGTVHWGAKVTGARPLGEGHHEVTLAGGSTFTTDLLVGADGAWSRIRPLVSDATPVYSGVSFVETDLLDADTRHPDSAAVIGGGMFFALGEGKGFLAHREPDGSLHVYTALKAPEDWISSIDFTDTNAAKAGVLEHFADWDNSLQQTGKVASIRRPDHGRAVRRRSLPGRDRRPAGLPPSEIPGPWPDGNAPTVAKGVWVPESRSHYAACEYSPARPLRRSRRPIPRPAMATGGWTGRPERPSLRQARACA
jgi:hypothetical protein